MALIQFTANYTDRSHSTGYQFEFHCDHCHNGFMSTFQASKMGMMGGFLRAASGLLGNNALDRAASAGDHVKDAFRGKAWDDAFARAVAEGKQHFKQCSRCGKWVCPEHCWNHERGLCEECAPNLAEEAAAAQATAAKEQIWEKARAADLVSDVDIKAKKVATCPHCGAKSDGGKFCPECGKPLAAEAACPSCGHKAKAGTKFCPECGSKMA
jgi:membrane protease subunit (stomatin/prohibitin family)